jgi:SapC
MAKNPAGPKSAPGQKETGRQPRAGMRALYSAPIELDWARHGGLGLNKNLNTSFAVTLNAVPVNLVEGPRLCHVYPIVFSPDGNAQPLAILGLRDGENLFVGRDGQWDADVYIPAYFRRYPFILTEAPGAGQLSLHFDNAPGILDEKSDLRLFEGPGKPSELVKRAMEYCKGYYAAERQTKLFSEALTASGILGDPRTEVTTSDGERIKVSAFRMVDEKKLADLPDKDFLEWRKRGWLPFLYAHLFSGEQWKLLSMLQRQRLGRDAGHKS